jgi:hypothetical protein
VVINRRMISSSAVTLSVGWLSHLADVEATAWITNAPRPIPHVGAER